MTWMRNLRNSYGEALLHALRQANGYTRLSEPWPSENRSTPQTKNNHDQPLPKQITSFPVGRHHSCPACSRFCLTALRADDTTDPKPAAVAAMQTWLKEIDDKQYEQSWHDASASFQKAVTSDQWIAALNGVRLRWANARSENSLPRCIKLESRARPDC